MFLMARNALSRLQDQSIMQQATATQSHQKQTSDFHDKYGNAVLASGATFCIAVRAYTATQTGTEWILSPVGSITPKEWRDQ
ncbi:cytochrome c oxidase subunit 7B, mitochondrial-like isoform X2 [Lontra canadensis]|uniref:cytochrome c oxidase subunit 7B, mitochondrial-like isoform X2 n=1 Tax=Lontra canadensis TaxID=76717 RepID=UPI0013F2DD99|nr:cytochrome c oxidase subunit 7B, mitochondrial-like isoform X2 [Lontra canadensis]